MRTLFVSTLALMLSTVWQPAQAAFVLVFDDPTIDGIEIQVVDNGPLDLSDTNGFIDFCYSQDPINVCASASSAPFIGSITAPWIRLEIFFIRAPGNLTIMASHTDLDTGFATAYTDSSGIIQSGNSVTFDYFGDSGNQPFERGFPIHSFGPVPSPSLNIMDSSQGEVTDTAGSMTVAIALSGGSGVDTLVSGAFIADLQLFPEENNVEVPDVTGLEQSAAEAAIAAAGLEVGAVSTQISDIVPAGNVISQAPPGGEEVPPGTSVNLVVSAGNDFEEVANQAGLAGLWFDPAFDGEGFNVIVGDGSWLLYYYGWRSNGQRLWLLSDIAVDPILFGKSVTLDLFIAISGTFADPDPDLSTWGQITIIFDSCTSGRAHLQGEDGTKTTALVKLLGIDALDCDS